MSTNAFNYELTGKIADARSIYSRATKNFTASGQTQLLFAKSLYYSNDVNYAYTLAQRAKKEYSGVDYFEFQAVLDRTSNPKNEETSLKEVVYCVPYKMRPRLELLRYYLRIKDTSNSIHWANMILQMPIKKESVNTQKIIEEVHDILNQIQN